MSAGTYPSQLNSVAANVKDAIKAYEKTTSLPYDDVPPELCRAPAGTKTIDLSSWSLLVNDAALLRIAAEDRDRIDLLARQSSVNQVRCPRHHAESKEAVCPSQVSVVVGVVCLTTMIPLRCYGARESV